SLVPPSPVQAAILATVAQALVGIEQNAAPAAGSPPPASATSSAALAVAIIPVSFVLESGAITLSGATTQMVSPPITDPNVAVQPQTSNVAPQNNLPQGGTQ